MSGLNYVFKGILSDQGSSAVAFLRSNSSTFNELENSLRTRGYTTIEVNFGKRSTDNFTFPDGSSIALPEEGRFSKNDNVFVVNLNSETLAGYRLFQPNGTFIPYVMPFEMMLAHSMAHADGTSVNPFTKKVMAGATEPDVINRQNRIAAEINAKTGSNIPSTVSADSGSYASVNTGINAGATATSSDKTWRFMYNGQSIGAGQNVDFNYQTLPYGKPTRFGGSSVFDIYSLDRQNNKYVSASIFEVMGVYYANFYSENSNVNYIAEWQGITADYYANDQIIDLAPGTTSFISGNRNTVITNDSQIGFGKSSSNTLFASNTNVTLLPSYGGPGSFLGVQGMALTIYNNDTNNLVNLNGNGSTASFNGVGRVGTFGSNQSITLDSQGNNVTVYNGFTGQSITGSSAIISMGANTSANVFGRASTINLTPNTASYVGVFGQNQYVTGLSGSNSANIGGRGSSVYVKGTNGSGSYIGLTDSQQTLRLGDSNFNVLTAPNLKDIDIYGDHANVSFGSNTSGNIHGMNVNLQLQSNSNSYAGVFGKFTVSGVRGNNVVNLGGEGTDATVYGSGSPYGYVGMTNSRQSLTLGDWGFTVHTAANLRDLNIARADHANIVFAENTTGNVHAINSNINLKPNTGSYLGIFGDAVVNGNDGNNYVNLGGKGTKATVSGSGTIGIIENDQALTATSRNAKVVTAPNLQGIMLNVSNADITLAANTRVKVIGDNNKIKSTSNNIVSVKGTENYVETVDNITKVYFEGFSNISNLSNTDNLYYYYYTPKKGYQYYSETFNIMYNSSFAFQDSGNWSGYNMLSPSDGDVEIGMPQDPGSNGPYVFPRQSSSPSASLHRTESASDMKLVLQSDGLSNQASQLINAIASFGAKDGADVAVHSADIGNGQHKIGIDAADTHPMRHAA